MAQDKSDNKMVGAYIPDRLFQVINLHTIARSKSKSAIFREGLLLWIEQNQIDIEELIKEIAQQLKTDWLDLKNKGEYDDFEVYKSDCHDALTDDNIPIYLANRIIKRLQIKYEANK